MPTHESGAALSSVSLARMRNCISLILAGHLTILLGCDPRPIVAPDPTITSRASVVPVVPLVASAPSLQEGQPRPNLIVASEGGIDEVTLEGTTTRKLSRTPARRPRRLHPTGDVLFVVPSSLELRRLSPDTGKEEVIARLPRGETCRPLQPLSVQEDMDFVIDMKRSVACLSLMDRNMNMVSLQVNARVNLTTHEVKSAIVIDLSHTCKEDPKAHAIFDCSRETSSNPPAPDPPGLVLPAGFHVESRSPSGRWFVLGGEVTEGDYIHRKLLLLESETRRVYPIVEGPWPRPIAPESPFDTVDVVSESTIRWIQRLDVLLVDMLLVKPGERTVRLAGDVALE
jgi:hypothetical protein